MRKRRFLFLALFVFVIFLLSESLAYAQRPNPPGPRGGPGASPQRSRGSNPPGPAGGPGAGPRGDRDNNPPGPVGGPGTNWENPAGPAGGPGASPDRRPMGNPPGPAGGPGVGPNAVPPPPPLPPPPLPPPPSTVEGVSNAPSGQQVSQQNRAESVPTDLQQKAIVDQPWEKMADLNKDGIVDKAEMQQWRQSHLRRGNNPPGPRGGPGAGGNNQ